MAKAQFQRNQRVWVEAVGAWALIERIVPAWARGFDEPVRIAYDVGLGREFQAAELRAEEAVEPRVTEIDGIWRLMRVRNKWQSPDDCAHHPFPGSFPVVVTDPKDWGGWRVPGAEYDRDPRRIERQARLIATAPQLMALALEMIALVRDEPENSSLAMRTLAETAVKIERFLNEGPSQASSLAETPSANAA